MSRISHVQSVDQTRIAYRTGGSGPSLVLVHGASADSTVLSLLTPLLEPHYTVHAMDRRGRGHSGDAMVYDIGLEYADVAAVVDQVAGANGRAVSLYGHSYGAVCALGAALLTPNIEQLFLYEPGYGAVLSPEPEVLDRLDDLIAAGDHDAALEHFYRHAVGMSADDVAAMRRQPSWHARLPPCPRSVGSFAQSRAWSSTRRRTCLSTSLPCCCSATAARQARRPSSPPSTTPCRRARSCRCPVRRTPPRSPRPTRWRTPLSAIAATAHA